MEVHSIAQYARYLLETAIRGLDAFYPDRRRTSQPAQNVAALVGVGECTSTPRAHQDTYDRKHTKNTPEGPTPSTFLFWLHMIFTLRSVSDHASHRSDPHRRASRALSRRSIVVGLLNAGPRRSDIFSWTYRGPELLRSLSRPTAGDAPRSGARIASHEQLRLCATGEFRSSNNVVMTGVQEHLLGEPRRGREDKIHAGASRTSNIF